MKAAITCHFTSPTDAQAVARRLGITRPQGETVVELEAEREAGPFRTEQVTFSIWRAGPLVLTVGEYCDGTPYARLLHDDEVYGVKARRGSRRRQRPAQGTLF